MAGKPVYEIVQSSTDAKRIVLRDIGDHSRHLTITNGIEEVVKELHDRGLLPATRRLYYYDSDDHLTRVIHNDHGLFLHFA